MTADNDMAPFDVVKIVASVLPAAPLDVRLDLANRLLATLWTNGYRITHRSAQHIDIRFGDYRDAR